MAECTICHTSLEQRGGLSYCPACSLRVHLGGDEDEPFVSEMEEETLIMTAPRIDSMPEVDQYLMLEKLGEGGFANVYRAQQLEPVRREVAVKVLKSNVATSHVLARFKAERQTLARMEHPGIARFWDSGVTKLGQPFFAMELVRGEPVTSYCERYKLGLKERLEVFMAICNAVQHAHEKGVLHRDLKPSNILVASSGAERVVKIIDFGIAKALEKTPETEEEGLVTSLHQAVGTPGYMSPEQSAWGAHHVDARSDLYALGVVLYELITGSTPLQIERRANVEAKHRLHAEHITVPSLLPHCFLATKTEKRDLDAIVMKALDVDSTLRYASVAAFADDVQRHLRDEPVLACVRSWTYVMEKFTRRHLPFVASAAVALLAIIVGFTVSTTLYFKEQKARTHAEETQKRVEARELELRHTLSRSDFAAAQQFKNAGEAQSAVACLTRALRQDPEFKAATADLQMMLIQDDTPQPVEKVILADPAWGDVVESLGAVSDGGHVLASVFNDQKNKLQHLILFRHQKGEWQRREIPLSSRVTAIALAASGNLLAVAEAGPNVCLYRSEDPSFERKWSPPSSVTALMTSTSTEMTYVGCADGSVWSLSSFLNEPAQRLGSVIGEVTALQIGTKDSPVIAASKTGEVRKMGVLPEGESSLLLKLPAEITALSTTASSLIIAAGDALGNVACCNDKGESLMPVTRLHESGVTALSLGGLQNQTMLLSAGGARDLRVRWTEVKSGIQINMPVESSGMVKGVVMTPSNDAAVIVNADASVRMWRKTGDGALTVRKPQRTRFIAMSSQGNCIAVRHEVGNSLEVLLLPQDPLFGAVIGLDKPAPQGLKDRAFLSFSSDGKSLLETHEHGVANLWDAGKASLLGSVQWAQPALAVVPLEDGKFHVALADGSLIEVMKDGGNPVVRVPAAPEVPWTLAAISPDGQAVIWATASPDLQQTCQARVWWAGDASPHEMKAERLSCVAIHAGKRSVAFGLGNGHVRLIKDKEDARGVFTPLHQSAITSIAFSPDGQSLITGSTDRTAAVWDARKVTPLTDAFRLGGQVQCVVFSADGKRFACSSNNQVAVGDVAARSLLGQPFKLPNLGRTLALNHDGTRVAFGLGHGNTLIHDIPPEPRTPAPVWFLKLAETYVSRRMTQQGTIEVMDHPGLAALQQLAPENESNEWQSFSTWMFKHTGLRHLTPWSELNLETYLREIENRSSATREIENRRFRSLLYHQRDMGEAVKLPEP